MIDRRHFLRHMCLGGMATFGLPAVRFASVPEPGRLVFMLLRGGFDGLAALVPYADPAYANARGAMAYTENELIPLEAGFGLAPGLAPLIDFWNRGELVALHAMAIPYRTRSHFDGQAVLETGMEKPNGSSDGWLNRLLQIMEGERTGIAIASGMPRSLSGSYSVNTWSPAQLGTVDDAYLDRLRYLYQQDEVLLNRFEAAIQQQELTQGMTENERGMGVRTTGRSLAAMMQATARMLRQDNGPNVAAMEVSGWDTHANQGLKDGALDRLLGFLASGLGTLREELGDTWSSTTVVVMTEFGRTVAPNGTRGTDHGTGGAGFILGPNVARSAVITDWPGLSEKNLFEGRDLRPTLDTRSVLKGVIAGTFDLTSAQVERVFPGSNGVRPMYELMGS